MKHVALTYTAAPPDVLRVDEKNLREYVVANVCGVVITTNHKTDGLYLPSDDRRHYVAWSHLTKEDFAADYWHDLYNWYAEGGTQHVAAYLAQFDLSTFDPKAPPQRPPRFWMSLTRTAHRRMPNSRMRSTNSGGRAPRRWPTSRIMPVLISGSGCANGGITVKFRTDLKRRDTSPFATRRPRMVSGAFRAVARPSTPNTNCRCETVILPRAP